jgi:hypothetical protein
MVVFTTGIFVQVGSVFDLYGRDRDAGRNSSTTLLEHNLGLLSRARVTGRVTSVGLLTVDLVVAGRA